MEINTGTLTSLEVLRSSLLLGGLSDPELLELAEHSTLQHVSRGEVIWLNGNEVDFFGIVGKGFVKMTRSTAAGHDVTTEIMGPGQVFGLLGVVDGRGCPQMATAVCETEFLKISKSRFHTVYRDSTILKDRLLSRTTRRLRGTYEMFSLMSASRVDRRIAVILLMLAESYGTEIDGRVVIEVPLTRQDISEMAGTTVESTIRTISGWQKRNLISTHRKCITLLSPAGLKSLLDS